MTVLRMETSPLHHGVLTIPSLGNDQKPTSQDPYTEQHRTTLPGLVIVASL